MNPEVSIITCLYNAERFIGETAKSVINQTFINFEWLIVDDGSTDSSGDIIKKLAAADKRIKLFFLDDNQGPIYARNYALERAKGRFIAILDSDDLWLPSKLQKQISFMKERQIPLSYTGYKKIRKNGKPRIDMTIPVPAKVSYDRILYSDSIMTSSAVYDTAVTGKIKQSHSAPVGKDDFHFFLSILKEFGCAYGIKEDLARLRISNGSITRNKLRSALLQWSFYRKTIGLSREESAARFIIYALKGFLKYVI